MSLFPIIQGAVSSPLIIIPGASNWSGNTGSFTLGAGTLAVTTGDDAIKSIFTSTGNFEWSMLATVWDSIHFGWYEIGEDGTFNQNLADCGMSSMTDSWELDGNANNIQYGGASQLSHSFADTDIIRVTREGGTFKVYGGAAGTTLIHTFTQTSTNEVRFVFGHDGAPLSTDISAMVFTDQS